MDAGTLHEAIAEVCPVTSVTVGKSDDRSTWSYVPGPSATPEQIEAGDNVVATIPIDTLSVLNTPTWIGRWTNAEYRAFMAAAWRGSGGNAKNADVVMFRGTIDMNKKATKTLKSDLVTGGILTQARADEIFS